MYFAYTRKFRGYTRGFPRGSRFLAVFRGYTRSYSRLFVVFEDYARFYLMPALFKCISRVFSNVSNVCREVSRLLAVTGILALFKCISRILTGILAGCHGFSGYS